MIHESSFPGYPGEKSSLKGLEQEEGMLTSGSHTYICRPNDHLKFSSTETYWISSSAKKHCVCKWENSYPTWKINQISPLI